MIKLVYWSNVRDEKKKVQFRRHLNLINLCGFLVRNWISLGGAILRRPVEHIALLWSLKIYLNQS